jgi:thioesterase domain-containing protein
VSPPLGTLVALRPEGSLPPLLCLPPASGSAFAYLALADILPAGRPVYAIEAPGYDDGQQPSDRLTTLSGGYLARLPDLGDGPRLLLGWSMGGMVAYDMACQLAAAGQQVGAVILVDVMGPGTAQPAEPEEEVEAFLLELAGGGSAPPVSWDGVPDGATADQLARHALRQLEQAGELPPEVEADFLASRFAVFHASVQALVGYRDVRHYPGTVTVIDSAGTPPEWHQGWERVAGAADRHVLPGDHYSIWQGASLRAIADIVVRSIEAGG